MYNNYGEVEKEIFVFQWNPSHFEKDLRVISIF